MNALNFTQQSSPIPDRHWIFLSTSYSLHSLIDLIKTLLNCHQPCTVIHGLTQLNSPFFPDELTRLESTFNGLLKTYYVFGSPTPAYPALDLLESLTNTFPVSELSFILTDTEEWVDSVLEHLLFLEIPQSQIHLLETIN